MKNRIYGNFTILIVSAQLAVWRCTGGLAQDLAGQKDIEARNLVQEQPSFERVENRIPQHSATVSSGLTPAGMEEF